MYEIYDKLRAEKKLTNYAVSKATGINQSVLSNWKNGRHVPGIAALQAIAGFFGVSLDYLLGRAHESASDAATEPGGGARASGSLPVEAHIEQVLSLLSDSKNGTLMLDGKPASEEAIESLKNAIQFGVEYARKVNSQH